MAGTSELVVECLSSHQSFVVEAGAGSGKTRTLVDALIYLLANRAQELLTCNQQIVCITYTNVAANEIVARIDRDPLVRVSTIHEFLWSVIQPFQKEMRSAILELNEHAGAKKLEGLDLTGKAIEYWQYQRKWEEGKITHDDVILLSAAMFHSHSKLSRLVADLYPIIFVDEYQDTHKLTVELLFDSLLARNPNSLTIGLFGDHMQRIYNTGVGKVERPEVRVIQKRENYRCSLSVIGVLNQLRPELQQVPGGANEAGSARFFYAAQDAPPNPVAALRTQLHAEDWTEESEKVLMLYALPTLSAVRG